MYMNVVVESWKDI